MVNQLCASFSFFNNEGVCCDDDDWQDGEAALGLLDCQEDVITMRDAMDEYNNTFILK